MEKMKRTIRRRNRDRKVRIDSFSVDTEDDFKECCYDSGGIL